MELRAIIPTAPSYKLIIDDFNSSPYQVSIYYSTTSVKISEAFQVSDNGKIVVSPIPLLYKKAHMGCYRKHYSYFPDTTLYGIFSFSSCSFIFLVPQL